MNILLRHRALLVSCDAMKSRRHYYHWCFRAFIAADDIKLSIDIIYAISSPSHVSRRLSYIYQYFRRQEYLERQELSMIILAIIAFGDIFPLPDAFSSRDYEWLSRHFHWQHGAAAFFDIRNGHWIDI